MNTLSDLDKPMNSGMEALERLHNATKRMCQMTDTILGRFDAVCRNPNERDADVPCKGYSEYPEYFRSMSMDVDSIERCLNAFEDFVNRCELPE